MNENKIILDIRDAADFNNFHIENAINIESVELENNFQKYQNQFKGKKVFVVCYRGNSSRNIAEIMRSSGIEAFTVRGGMIEWSKENLPRWKAEGCVVN